jgi:PQQ-dependent dehydrogenase (methanol/ethanol family)
MHMRAVSMAAVVLLAACTGTPEPAADPAVAGAGREWPATGGDLGNTRYSSLRAIATGTVATLGAAWVTPLEGEVSKASPVVKDGLLYVTASKSVHALDARTGAPLWRYQPEGGGLSFNTKGLGVGDGRVYVGLADTRVAALDARTGALLWIRQVAPELPRRLQLQTAAPAYAKGIVVAAVSGGDLGTRGRVVGLDAATGEILWTFHTVPAPGDRGHETWPKDSAVWENGGGAVWMNAALDTDLDLVLVGVGNAVPQYGGEVRAGDNLFTASALALDLRTGAYRWHYQTVHHDLWDADLGTPLVLYNARVAGRTVKAVAVMRTDGLLFELDRKTGRPLHPVEERPVPQNPRLNTAATQPFPVGGQRVGLDCVDPAMIPSGFKAGCFFDPVDVEQPNVMLPFATTRQAPMAYSPATGFFYVAGGVSSIWHRRGEDPYYYAMATAPGMHSYGLLAAIDAGTRRIVWQKRLPYPVFNGSGALATGGGLVFHGEPDGTLQAYDARSGDLLWQFQTGAPAEGPPVTYEAGGEQYVAMVSSGSAWGFKLGGTLPARAAPTPKPTVTTFSGRIIQADRVTMAAEVPDTLAELGVPGKTHLRLDEFAFHPLRIRVKAGASVTWSNAGREFHEARAVDGSWSTGRVPPGGTASVSFAKPGTYAYQCGEHPWSVGQVIVE